MHDWPFVSDGDLWRCQVQRSELLDSDCQRDQLRMGYLIRPGSVTYTLLTLRGCDLKRPRQLRISDAIKAGTMGNIT